jgi:hypothetical protein
LLIFYFKQLNALAQRNEYGIELPVGPSDLFQAHITKLFDKAIEKVAENGVLAFKFKFMYTSPRITPQSVGKTINSLRKDVRCQIFRDVNEKLAAEGKIIVDVDFKSCFTSILLGFYPRELILLKEAIENKGLWEYIKDEFDKAGKRKLFNKPAIKICVYASFFLGGHKAFISGIMKHFEKELAMTAQEFREFDQQPALYELARGVAEFMMRSEIIHSFKRVSKMVYETHEGGELSGPSGHYYPVRSRDDLRTAYANYLMSFQFTLLAESTLRFLESNPDVELIGHLHDGNLLVMPLADYQAKIAQLNSIVLKVGKELGLTYPQSIETNVFL